MPVDTDDPTLHAPLFTPAAQALGRAHWYFLNAIEQFEALALDLCPVSSQGRVTFTRAELTGFGRVAGLDPIRWWISQGERNLPELELRTREAYEGAQPLLKSAEQLLDVSSLPVSYAAIVERLGVFADEHEAKIVALLRYTEWLYARDAFAPAILFSHDVWGSTRRADRMTDLDGRSFGDEKLLNDLTLIAFGFRDRMMFTVDYVHNEIMGEMYDARLEAEAATVPGIHYEGPSRHTDRGSALGFQGGASILGRRVKDRARAGEV